MTTRVTTRDLVREEVHENFHEFFDYLETLRSYTLRLASSKDLGVDEAALAEQVNRLTEGLKQRAEAIRARVVNLVG